MGPQFQAAPTPVIAAPTNTTVATGTAAITGTAATFPTAGYIDQQGNLWQLGASGQVAGPDAVNLGALNSASLTAANSQALSTAISSHTSQSSGYLLLDSTALAAVESAYGIGSSGFSGSTLLLIAAGAAAVFLMSRH